MSDGHVKSDNKANVPEGRGGWRRPEKGSTWRKPEKSATWRKPTDESDSPRQVFVPANLEERPRSQGAWHRPKAADTTLDVAPSDGADEAAESLEAVADLAEAVEKAVSVEQVSEQAAAELEEEDEDDGATFSMSELVALASLVDDVPVVEQPSTPSAALTDSEPVTDPAVYARRELEKLQSQRQEAIAPPEEAEQPAVAALTEAERKLLQKYRDTEKQVKALRARFAKGEISRAEFQAALHTLVVRDDDGRYWSLGVESENWYVSEQGKWVVKMPPVLEKAAHLGAEEEAASAASAPAPLEVTQPTTPPPPQLEEGHLPRKVPVRDPEYTVPGARAIEFGTEVAKGRAQEGDLTVPSRAVSEAEAAGEPAGTTVPSPAVVESTRFNAAIPSVPSPVPAPDVTRAPEYDLQRPSPAYETARRRQQQRTLRMIAILAAVGVGLMFIMGACGILAGVLYYRSLAAPFEGQIAALANYQPQFQTARILASDGSLIAELIGQNSGARTRIALEDISPYMIHALIAVENERYYDDAGWDPIAIARAFLQNLASGQIESGASTLTQQIARNLILQDTTVSAERKLQEIVIASEIAQRYDKNFILELYLNEFFFGNQSYGVEAAAQFYFGHSAADLNMAEAALLAGIIQAPARYDPVVNRDAAFDRMDFVLQRMAEVGCIQFQHAPYLGQPFCVTEGDITSGEVVLQKALVESRSYQPRTYQVRFPHFVNYIQAQIEQHFGTAEMFRRGFVIRTTLNPRIQETAQTALQQQVAALAPNGVNTGAVFVTDPRTGAILAMVGSPDFDNEQIDGQVNNVFTWQQPGSSIKPVVYTAALEGVERNGVFQYMTPATILWDVPTTFATIPPYTPVNYDRIYHGPVALRFALGNSYNVPAIKAYDFIGADRFRDTAMRMGLRFLEEAQFGLPTAIGADEVRLYDHVQAYATLANNGVRVPVYAITEITDASGASVEPPPRAEPSQTVQPQIAFLMQNILSDNEARAAAFGLNNGLALPEYPGLVAAKTGTSNDNRDLWTMGFTRNVVVGVWLGRHDNAPTSATTQVSAVPVWNTVMRAALQGNPPEPFTPPQGIAQATICADTGTLFDPNINPNCTTLRNEIFVQNAPPPSADQGFVQTVRLDSWTGLRANQYCPDNVVDGRVVNIADPSAIAWLNSPDGAAYAQRIGLTPPVQSAAVGECTPGMALPQARINAPTDGQTLTGQVQVIGIMTAPNFNRYQLEIAPAENPESFTVVAGPFGNQQPNGALGTWDTTVWPNGVYRLRLAAFANDGGYLYRTVQVGVNNPIPTPTPLIVPTSFPTSGPIGFTPIPFETPIPFGGISDLGPTPTIDFTD